MSENVAAEKFLRYFRPKDPLFHYALANCELQEGLRKHCNKFRFPPDQIWLQKLVSLYKFWSPCSFEYKQEPVTDVTSYIVS